MKNNFIAGFVCSGLCLKASNALRRKWLKRELHSQRRSPDSRGRNGRLLQLKNAFISTFAIAHIAFTVAEPRKRGTRVACFACSDSYLKRHAAWKMVLKIDIAFTTAKPGYRDERGRALPESDFLLGVGSAMLGLVGSQMERFVCLKANSNLRRKRLQMEIAFTAAEPRSKEAEVLYQRFDPDICVFWTRIALTVAEPR